MTIQGNIRKWFLLLLWCGLGTAIIVLLLAAINRKSSRTCKLYHVTINKGGQTLFVSQHDITDVLTDHGIQKLVGRTLISFDLRSMEMMLKKNNWIKNAELFFDNNDALEVNITERVPVARVFTRSGASFCLDSGGLQLPLPELMAVKLPVFTAYPGEKIRMHGKDSILVRGICNLSGFFAADPFWMAEIEQINITQDRNFEMVPVMGNHLITFGGADGLQDKFRRLMVFYQQVMAIGGFDKYCKLDLRYAGQVVATKRAARTSRSDSLKTIENIEHLIRSAQQLTRDTVQGQDIKPLEHNTQTEQTLVGYDLIEDNQDSAAEKPAGGALQRKTKGKK